MELLKNRPFAACCFIFVSAALFCALLPVSFKIGMTSVCTGLFFASIPICIALRKRLGTHVKYIVAALLFAAIASAGSYAAYGIPSYYAGSSQRYSVCAKVTDVNSSSVYSSSYDVRISSIDGKYMPFLKATLTVPETLERGDIILCDALFEDGYSSAAAAVEFDNASKLYMSADSVTVTGNKAGLFEFFRNLNDKFAARLDVFTGGDGGGLASALFLGNQKYLSESVVRDFRRIGISHMLALSGMHLVILTGGFIFVSRKLRVPVRFRGVVVIALTAVYMLLSGMSPSIMRAGIMLMLTYGAKLIRLKPDDVTNLSTAAVIILTVSPTSMTDVGFQLSFAAMLALEAAAALKLQYRIYRRLYRFSLKPAAGKIRKIAAKSTLRAVSSAAGSFLTTLAVLLVTLPVVWLHYGTMPLLSPLCNVIFAPLISICLYLSPLCLMFGSLAYIGTALNAVLRAASSFVIFAAGKIAELRYIELPVRGEITYFAVAIIAAGVIMLVFCRRGLVRYALSVSLTGVALLISLTCLTAAASADDVYLLPVSSGSNDMLLLTSDNAATVVDVSNGAYLPMYKAVSAAKGEGVLEIESIVLTHLHARHAVTLRRIFAREYIRTLYIPVPADDDERAIAERIVKAALEEGVNVTAYERTADMALNLGRFNLIFAPYTEISRSTHPVIMLTVATECGSALYIGVSVNESDLASYANAAAASVECVIFGAHGPKMKSTYSYTVAAALKSVYFMQNALDFASDNLTAAVENITLAPNTDKSVFINVPEG